MAESSLQYSRSFLSCFYQVNVNNKDIETIDVCYINPKKLNYVE